MRTGKFTKQLTGNLEYKAFIPNELPFEIKIDSDLQDLLSKANIAIGRLDGNTSLIPDVDFFIKMYITKEASLSSQIEGTTATFIDAIKANSKIQDTEIRNDVDEIINYISAMNYGLKRLDTLPLSLRLIKEIHEKLLKGVRGKNKAPGEFRRTQNWIGGRTIQTASFVPPPHHEILRLLNNLEKFMHDKSPIPVLIKVGLIHAQFEAIHPFLDGNGRVGRLLITFYLCHEGILKKPLLYLSEYIMEHRYEYYEKLNAAHGKDDIEGWLKYFLDGVAVTSEKAAKVAIKIHNLRENDLEKVSKIRSSQKGIKLLNTLCKNPILQIKDVEKITGLKNPNAITMVSKFESLGILKETTGQKRNKVYEYRNYIKLFE